MDCDNNHKIRTWFRGQRTTLDAEHKAVFETNHGAVWIHAASVGEFEQARPLIERIKAENKTRKVVVTFFSPSGYEARKNYESADAVLYLPLPTRRNAKRFLDALQPSMVIFVKYEFWPAFLKALKKRNIPAYCISAIFRPTQRFFRPWGKPSLRLLRCFTRLYVQDEASRRLLAEHGIHDCTVAGDTRFDRVEQIRKDTLQQTTKDLTPVAHFAEGCDKVVIAGSTWPEDEALLVNCPHKLILVPHEIDNTHLHYIFNLFEGRIVRYSAVAAMPANASRYHILHRAQVLVVDTIGLLSSIYRFGQVAYIGGGFGAGIHNTIEAAAYGMPVLFGPNYNHFREAKGLIDAGAAQCIHNEKELVAALDIALADHAEIGAKAAAYVAAETGATDKIYKELFN